MFERGFPVAPCPSCQSEQIVWREPETGASRCLRCDTPLDAAGVRPGDMDAVASRNNWVIYDVTESMEPCACDTCPGNGHCHHEDETGEVAQ